MYIILLPSRLWYTADTWQEVKDFLKVVFVTNRNTFYKTKVFRRITQYQWEDIYIPEELVK